MQRSGGLVQQVIGVGVIGKPYAGSRRAAALRPWPDMSLATKYNFGFRTTDDRPRDCPRVGGRTELVGE